VHPRRSALVPALLLALLAACASGGGGARPSGTPGGMAPADAVERFMRASEKKDYNEMAWLFGTTQGSVLTRDPRPDAERRMFTISSVLEHDRFAIRDESPVPGSATGEVGFTVQLTSRGHSSDVPFTVVRGPAGRWFVEKIGLEAVTAATQQ
jgi:hypothetical protein